MTIAPIAALGTAWIVTLVILAILIIALVIVGVWGNKQQKKSADAQQQLQHRLEPVLPARREIVDDQHQCRQKYDS